MGPQEQVKLLMGPSNKPGQTARLHPLIIIPRAHSSQTYILCIIQQGEISFPVRTRIPSFQTSIFQIPLVSCLKWMWLKRGITPLLCE